MFRSSPEISSKSTGGPRSTGREAFQTVCWQKCKWVACF